VSVVILTIGDRPVELRAAVASALEQRDVDVEVVVVANGCPPDRLTLPSDDRVRVVATPENLGIPGGRNLGAGAATAEIVAFLDDDASYLDAGVLARALDALAVDPWRAVIAQRIVDQQGATARRHVPRLGARGVGRGGPVAAFLGGAAVVRRSAFLDVGGYPAAFRYAMEETDLAWRLVDAGWRLHYDGRPAVRHPASEPTRHADARATTMRNRVWMVHRCLPAPLAILYVVNWFAVSAVRAPSTVGLLARATLDGWRTRPGPRAPIRYRSVWSLTRVGRPPVL
jgi:GT2 family glycosyltransferase